MFGSAAQAHIVIGRAATARARFRIAPLRFPEESRCGWVTGCCIVLALLRQESCRRLRGRAVKSRCGSTSQALRRQLSLRRRAKREGEGEEWVTDWHFQVSSLYEGEPREGERPAYGIELHSLLSKVTLYRLFSGC